MSKSMSMTGMRVWHVGPGSLGYEAGEGPRRGGMKWGGVQQFLPLPIASCWETGEIRGPRCCLPSAKVMEACT